MKIVRVFIVAVTFASLTSFIGEDEMPVTPGTYGVCDCNSNNQLAKPFIELTINPDHTFRYIDNSDPAAAFDISGNWITKNEKVKLLSAGRAFFHSAWEADGLCIQSRYKLNFRRLCLIKPCSK